MKNSKKYMIAGFLSIIPIYLTFIIARFLFERIAVPGSKLFENTSEYFSYLPEILGFFTVLITIYIIGMLVSNIFVRSILMSFEKIISGIPVVNMIYKTDKTDNF